MNKLKPCPFCGEKLNKYEYVPLRFVWRHPYNECYLSKFCVWDKDIKAWNRRVENESQHNSQY